MYDQNKDQIDFSAEKFVDNLIIEGSKVPCDDTLDSFKITNLPPYYDAVLYKRGQKYVQDNLCGINIGNICGLVTVLTLAEDVKILMCTGMSSSNMTAYRRYLAALLHVLIWYDDDNFEPGSRLLASLQDVKRQHNSASKKGKKLLEHGINQKAMAATQFGFIGYAVIRNELLGIHDPNEEDVKGFIHVWRVIGYLLGIEDRFNICRESVEETKEIFDQIMKKLLLPGFENPSNNSVVMMKYLVNGMSAIEPMYDYESIMVFTQMLWENTNDYNKLTHPNYQNLSLRARIKATLLVYIMYYLKHRFVRVLVGFLLKFKLRTLHFNISAILRFGYTNSQVQILNVQKPIYEH